MIIPTYNEVFYEDYISKAHVRAHVRRSIIAQATPVIHEFENVMFGFFAFQKAEMLRRIDAGIDKPSDLINKSQDNELFVQMVFPVYRDGFGTGMQEILDIFVNGIQPNQTYIQEAKGLRFFDDILQESIEEKVNLIRRRSKPKRKRPIPIPTNRPKLVEQNVQVDFDSVAVRAATHDRAEYIAKTVNDTTFRRVLFTIRRGIAVGESTSELQDRVHRVFRWTERGEDHRVRTIAHTEAFHILNAGKFAGAKESKVVQWKQWVSQMDGKTRTPPRSRFDHVAADGERVRLDEFFRRTGESLMHPIDTRGSVANTVFCRCSVMYLRFSKR